MTSVNLNEQLQQLSMHYDSLAKAHGYSPHAVQQSSLETQEKRLSVLLEGFPDFKSKKILDFGCGTGHFFQLLQRNGFCGEYVGYDISPQLVRIARENHPTARFELNDVLRAPPSEQFDLVFISGVFNNDIKCNQQFMHDVLPILFAVAREGLAFNCLSSYVDYKAEGLYYFDPGQVFAFCKEQLTPSVTLRHDYEIKPGVLPFEFSCYLHKVAHQPRLNNHD